MPPAAGLRGSELQPRSKSSCAQHNCISPSPLSTPPDRFVFLITLSPQLLLLIARHSHFSPSSPHITAKQSSTQPSGFAAAGKVTVSKWQLVAGSTPHQAATARYLHVSVRIGICDSYTHRFPLAAANKGQVRCRTALISYKLKLITIIMKGCMNMKFVSFAVVFTNDRLAK